MVNGSRFGVAIMGLGIHRRSFLEAAIYAAHREQWGQRIDQYPLVRETLVDLLVELEAGMALTFECARREPRRCSTTTTGRLLRRILVPLAKVRATREAIGAASQALEILGGNGYMEDWPMARQLRDAQCHTIWEGTENICCLDVRRAMRNDSAHDALIARVEQRSTAPTARRSLADDRRRGGRDARRGARRRSRTSRRPTPTSSCCTPGASRYLLADLAEGALLLDEATLAADAATATPARPSSPAASPAKRLAPPRARGILDDDRTAIDLFEALVRYGPVEPADAA